VSICDSGIGSKAKAGEIVVEVAETHPLIMLAAVLPWLDLYEIILDDLKKSTKKGFWWLGRKLKVRIHLAAFILQQLYNITDRETEYGIKDNAAYRVFCGYGIVEKWHAPDHTKIEEFRSRLSSETQRILANTIAQHAAALGIADPKDFDIDSTVQEANMTYPTDAKMLRKLGALAAKVSGNLKKIFGEASFPSIDLKEIASKARNCFFQKRYATQEEKSESLEQLWNAVSQPVTQTIQACSGLCQSKLDQLKWNVKRAVNQLVTQGHEFGRAFQLARIGGNFMIAAACTSVRMDDKKSVEPIIADHEKLFGANEIETLSTDKGYYSKKNVKHAVSKGISKVGIQAPESTEDKISKLSAEDKEALYNRRSGIEPLIGHIKQGGQLGRSRMKSDETIKASGYASVLGFNLRQTIKAKIQENQRVAA